MSRFNKQSAFTLIELLVVIVVIGVLVAILIPAIQAGRETSRRSHCSNNLRQIGLSMQSYHASLDVFPPGYYSASLNPSPVSIETGPGWGWASFLLNHLEQPALFNSINFSLSITVPQSQTSRSTSVNTYLCPSSISVTTFIQISNIGDKMSLDDVSPSHYVGSAGLLDPEDHPNNNSGLFYRNSALSHRDLTDGSSTTIFVGERSRNLADATWVGAVPGYIVCPNLSWRGASKVCEEASAMTLGYSEPRGTVEFSMTPNSLSASAGNFWSSHTSGCNFLFGDGSVRLISTTINPKTFAALITRSGGELVGNDF